MPAATQENLVNKVNLTPSKRNVDDEEALRSQLMSGIEHNNDAWSQNKSAMAPPEDIDGNVTNEDTLDQQDSEEEQNGETELDNDSDQDQESADETTDEEVVNGNDEVDESEAEVEVETKSEEEEDSSESESEGEDEDEDTSGEPTTAVESVADDDGAEETEDESDVDEQDLCIFCQQVKEEATDADTTDLACAVCRKPAHKRCAQLNNAVRQDSDPTTWRCPECLAKQTSESPKSLANKARHSAPRLVRDLLPVSRGVQKPGAHSIFAQPLIQDIEEGGRALRKRKSSTGELAPRLEKRRKTTGDASSTNVAAIEELRSQVGHSTRRSSQKLVPVARILQYRPFHKPPPHKFILAFRLDQSRIDDILNKPPRPTRKRDRKRPQKIPPPPVYQPPVPKFPALPTHNLIFPSMFGDRENETNVKPYGGILSEAEADTSRSYPQMRDREIFEIARKEAEEDRRKTSATAEAEINGEAFNATKPNRTVSGPPSKIKCIQFGKFVIDTSYAAPYPEEYSHESRLFICEFCLKYLPSEFVAYRHKLKCPAKHPPGDEIYRDGTVSIWEVDGRKKTEYCQCLCLMAKLFLGSKTLYYDVDPFLFYILTEYDELGYHFVGYFSKEKRPASQNNVSCILVMPIHQRKGYATFLIDFSYLLTRIEGKDGSPEKPLSDMGLTAYRSYWDLTLSKELLGLGDKPFSVKDLMGRTGMTADDVVHSLERLYAFIKDPVTKTYAIRFDKKLYENIVSKYDEKQFRRIKPDRLVWTPYVMGRSDAAILDGQPMQTIAQREDDIPEVDEEATSRDVDMEDVSEVDHVSPKTSRVESRHSTENAIEEETAPVNEHGNVAPGPPSTDALNAPVLAVKSAESDLTILINGHNETDGQDEEPLTGYALTYRTEKIPASRFQIDPPIPPSMLRNRSVKKKGQPGTPRINGTADPGSSPIAVRSSPRKAGSVSGSVSGQISRATSPDKAATPTRRSLRKSGLATEIVATDTSADEDQAEAEEEAKSDDAESEGSSEESEEGSEEDEVSVVEESDNSSDPDAEVEEDDEEESEDGAGSESDVDIPSAVSGAEDDEEEDGEDEEDEDEDR